MPPVECRITRQKKINPKQEAIRMIRNLYRVHYYLTVYFDHIQKKTKWDYAFLVPVRYFRHKALETTVLKRVSNTEHRG